MTHFDDPSSAIGDPVPPFLIDWLEPFRGAFSSPTWRLVAVLVMGALLAPGKRTVSACLRVTGRAMCETFSSYHQVLNRARWDPRDLSRRLVLVLVARLAGQGPIIIGLDDTIERRWGARIKARGIYRDPVRSSHGHFVKTSGLRWLSFMLLVPLPWSPGIRALPFLTILAPSERFAARQGRRHKQLTDWARQGMLQILRWVPQRAIVFVADSSFGTHELAWRIGQRATLISRLRLDANLFAPPPPRDPNKRGRPRQKGPPLPKLQTRLDDPDARWTSITLPRWYGSSKEKTLQIISDTALWYRPGTPPKAIRWVLVRDPEGERDPQAFFCTDTNMEPAKIIATFVRRWQVEVTFQELRAHLGLETQRQWSHAAIARTTPVLCGLYSLVCLWATDVLSTNHLSYAAAWYQKTSVTFSDAIAAIRCQLWLGNNLSRSPPHREPNIIPPDKIRRMQYALCFAA